MENRQLPKNIEAEREVLGIVFNDNSKLVECELEAADFYDNKHKLIYSTMLELIKNDLPISVISVVQKLNNKLVEVGGITYISELMSSTFETRISYYASLVKESSNKRKIIRIAQEVIEKAYDKESKSNELVNEFSEKNMQVGMTGKKKVRRLDEVLQDAIKIIEENYKNGGDVIGMTTGFKSLDKLLNGVKKGELITIAARPSMGKTALALQISNCMSKENKGCYFQLEMRDTDMVLRMLSSESLVDGHKMNRGAVDDQGWIKIMNGVGKLGNRKLLIDEETDLTVYDIRNRVKQLKMKSGLDFIIIDHLTLVKDSNKDKRLSVSEVTRQCKMMAKSLDIAVILLAQLSRAPEQRADHRPMLCDLKESGTIEEDSDKVLMIYRDEYYNKKSDKAGILEINIAKNRNGRVGSLDFIYKSEYQLISEIFN